MSGRRWARRSTPVPIEDLNPDQASLFDAPPEPDPRPIVDVKSNLLGLAGRDDTPTQKAGAAARPRRGTQRFAVLAAIAASDGLTDDELGRATSLTYPQFSPRRRELMAAGLVQDSGRTRPSSLGGDQVVWIATEAGVRAWEQGR